MDDSNEDFHWVSHFAFAFGQQRGSFVRVIIIKLVNKGKLLELVEYAIDFNLILHD